jgi:hypothetical protein
VTLISESTRWSQRGPEGEWRLDALCRDMPHEWFFPERGRPIGGRNDPVREICASCAVSAECLADALASPLTEYLGFRGGTSGRERRLILHPKSKPRKDDYY